MNRNHHYSTKMLSLANHKISSRKDSAISEAKTFITEYFKGLDIPERCIDTAIRKTFDYSSTQDELNMNAKNYLVKNISKL